MFSFCMNLMYAIRCRLYFVSQTICKLCLLLQTECRLCFLSSSNRWADVSTSVTIVDSSSNSQMTSAHPLLLGATVATIIFCPSLLSYHCSYALVAMGRLPVAIVTYNLLLQCLFIIVQHMSYQHPNSLPPHHLSHHIA
jgi:hypothetical protein